jgi:Uma2 family endonuclease
MTADPAYRLMDAPEFLDMHFGPEQKAELDRGVIRMTAGGTAAHARVQGNLMRFLGNALRGSGCRPFGPDMAVKTALFSVRYPDVSIFCGDQAMAENDRAKAFDDPVAVFEVLSESTASYDQLVKLEEYRVMQSVQTIVFVDPETELCRVVQRTGAQSWHDDRFSAAQDVTLPGLSVTLPHAEIFARD